MVCRLGGMHDFVKVLDFGLAKLVERASTTVTKPGTIVGTLAYLAPECILDVGAASPQSDIYAVGCLAVSLLTGHDPFEQHGDLALISAHLTAALPALDAEKVPPALATIVTKCLAKDPADRYQSVRQLAGALERLDLPVWSEAEAAEWWADRVHAAEPPPSDPSAVRSVRPARAAGGAPADAGRTSEARRISGAASVGEPESAAGDRSGRR
jgi:serine/threonine protein kinase